MKMKFEPPSSTSGPIPAGDLAQFFRCSVDILMNLDRTGRIVAVSDSYKQLTGDAPSEASGKSCLEYVAEADVQRTAAEIGWVLTHGAETSGFENLVRDREGGFRVISWRGITTGEGTICAIGRDVTEQRQPAERALHARRLQTRAALISDVYEANNSLAAALGLVELGRRRTQEQSTLELLDRALCAGRRSSDVIQRILAAAGSRGIGSAIGGLERVPSLDGTVLLGGGRSLVLDTPSHQAQQGTPAESGVVRLKYFPRDHSVFVDDKYLIRGAAGALFWKLANEYASKGRTVFTSKELRVATDLPVGIESNLDSRLLMLRQRLDEKETPIRLERISRGEYRVWADGLLRLEICGRP